MLPEVRPSSAMELICAESDRFSSEAPEHEAVADRITRERRVHEILHLR